MASVEHTGLSLDEIIKADKAAKRTNKGGRQQKTQTRGPARGGARRRDSPYSSGSNDNWTHDKFDTRERREPRREAKPAKPAMTEAERGYKVAVSNTVLSEDEYKALLEGSPIKHVRTYAAKKVASLFFEKKEDALKAVADFNGNELPGTEGEKSVWAYVEWEERPPREQKPRKETARDRPASNRHGRSDGGRSDGGRIDPNEVVISVKY